MRLSGQPDSASAGDELLAAIREVFDQKQAVRLPTASLLEALCADAEGPWATWNRGKEITPRQIARKLADFKIRPTTFRLPNGSTPKGYARESFADAWSRYLPPGPPDLSATPQQVSNGAGSGAFAIRNSFDSVADEKPLKARQDATCCGVADGNPLPGEVAL